MAKAVPNPEQKDFTFWNDPPVGYNENKYITPVNNNTNDDGV